MVNEVGVLLIRNFANFGAGYVPLFTDLAELINVIWGDNGAHAFLRFRSQNLCSGHVLCAQRNIIQIDHHAAIASCCQLRSCTRQATTAEVLNTYNHACGVKLQAAFDENLLGEWVADLHGWKLALFAFFE